MDFYVILGIERSASPGDVKRAYRRLARRFHPDINPGDRQAAARFEGILEAYETLSDPERRRQYDTVGPTAVPAEVGTFGFKGFDFSVSMSGSPASTFGDLFGDVMQREPRPAERAPERGPDIHQSVTIGLEDAVRGTTRELTVTRFENCSACRGTGAVRTAQTRCLSCHGTGSITSARGHMVFSRPCSHCGGSGVQVHARCPRCNGQQGQIRTGPVAVTLPAGVADGTRVRLPGKGHAGRNGGEAGDLFVAVSVAPHALFRRERDDLHVTVPVAVHEAALGARIDVPSIDGPARLRVPPGTQSGQRFRLRERGVPSAHAGRRGDLIVEVRLVLPAILDERSKELLREFGRINSEDVRSGLNGSGVRQSV